MSEGDDLARRRLGGDHREVRHKSEPRRGTESRADMISHRHGIGTCVRRYNFSDSITAVGRARECRSIFRPLIGGRSRACCTDRKCYRVSDLQRRVRRLSRNGRHGVAGPVAQRNGVIRPGGERDHTGEAGGDEHWPRRAVMSPRGDRAITFQREAKGSPRCDGDHGIQPGRDGGAVIAAPADRRAVGLQREIVRAATRDRNHAIQSRGNVRLAVNRVAPRDDGPIRP